MAAAAMVMRKTVKKKIAGEIPAIRLFPRLSGEGLTFILITLPLLEKYPVDLPPPIQEFSRSR
jgi:hypothetical protein